MDYVYTISYRGVVFYVGSSGQPLNRFYYHVSGNNLYTRFRVYEILKKGNFPKLTIVYHSPDKKEVLKKERELIKQMYESGANIVNVRGNKNFVKISKIKSTKERCPLGDGCKCLANVEINNVQPPNGMQCGVGKNNI